MTYVINAMTDMFRQIVGKDTSDCTGIRIPIVVGSQDTSNYILNVNRFSDASKLREEFVVPGSVADEIRTGQ